MNVVVSAWAFPTPAGATTSLSRLSITDSRDAGFADAIAITWPTGDAPRWEQMTSPPGSPPQLDRNFWDLTVGLVFQVPLLRATAGEPNGDALLDSDPEIERYLVNRLRDELVPGTSILLIIGSPVWIDAANGAVRHDSARNLYTFTFSPKFAAMTEASIVTA